MKVFFISVVVVLLINFHPSSFLERSVASFSLFLSLRTSLVDAPKHLHAKIALREILEKTVTRIAAESNGF
jgi:hypothetical protein